MKMKICSSCGKRVEITKSCTCSQKRKQERNEYQKEYYRKNKENLKLLTRKKWKDLRKVIINRDGGHCQRCKIKFGVIETDNLQVHHIKPRIEYPELMYDENNLICLCKTCNLQLGTSGKLDFEQDNDNKEIIYNL